MLFVRGQAIRWISDEQPGIIEVVLTDVGGLDMDIHRQGAGVQCGCAIGREPLSSSGQIGCVIVNEHAEGHGPDAVVISTAEPWDVDSTDGQHEFVVRRSQLVETRAD